MKRIAGMGLVILSLVILAAPALVAQEEHGEVSVFADYMRLRNANSTNFWGPGASVAFNLNKYAAVEGSMAYDPEKTFAVTTGSGTTLTTNQIGLRLWHGEFGPKFQTGIGPARLFAVAKGGFLNFSMSNQGIATGFSDAVSQFTSGNTHPVFYPGVGAEVGKRFGLRLEVGDLMYFDRGANHNLRVSIGPKLSF